MLVSDRGETVPCSKEPAFASRIFDRDGRFPFVHIHHVSAHIGYDLGLAKDVLKRDKQ